MCTGTTLLYRILHGVVCGNQNFLGAARHGSNFVQHAKLFGTPKVNPV